MERLSGLDASFLSMETATARMHMANLTIVDPATCPGGFTFSALRARYAALVDRTPAFRQRLVEVPFGLHHPVWADDPAFDLDWHLRHVAVPAPGGIIDLCELAGHLVAIPLDRSRPLWETWLVEGVDGGRVAVLTKVHHAALGGPTHEQLLVALFDPSADSQPTASQPTDRPSADDQPGVATPPPVGPLPSDAAMLAHALAALATQPLRAASTVRRTLEAALRLRGANRQEPGLAPPPSPFTAPRTSFNATITAHRTFAATSLPLSRVQAIKRATGVTVHDVVLTVCAGALRRYLDNRHERPDGPLVAMVPVSVRAEGATRLDEPVAPGGEGTGSAVAAVLTTLATDVDDPAERLRLVHEGMGSATRQRQAIDASTLRSWVDFAPPAVAGQAARLYSRLRVADRHRPIFNITIANVPGPASPLSLAGARVLATYPMSPIFDGAGLNISVLSHGDSLDFGILTCPELVPVPWILADALHASLDELAAAIVPTGRSEPPPPTIPGPGRAPAAGPTPGPDQLTPAGPLDEPLELLTHHDALARTVPLVGRRVVDVGCGSGALVRWLRTQGADVVGVECGEAMRRLALDADPDHHDDYLDGIGQALPLPDASADVIVYSYSLHHVPPAEMLDALADARRVLRPGATLYVAEPVAAGAGHEVVRLIDDETEKRGHAQAALDQAGSVGFEPVDEWRYLSRTVVADADALATRLVGVDPTRTERMRRHRAEFEARFAELAIPVAGGFAFDTENHVRILRAT